LQKACERIKVIMFVHVCILPTQQSHVNPENNRTSSCDSVVLSNANPHGSMLAWLPRSSRAPFLIKQWLIW